MGADLLGLTFVNKPLSRMDILCPRTSTKVRPGPHGVQGVASSNPAVPTSKNRWVSSDELLAHLFFCLPDKRDPLKVLMPRPVRHFIAMLLVLLAAPAVGADLLEIAWGADGSYEQAFNVSSAKPVEICGRLPAGTNVRWRFESDAPTEFNVHHHEGPQVHFAAKEDDSRKAEGVLQVKQDQDYCWMWTKKASPAASVRVRLDRSR